MKEKSIQLLKYVVYIYKIFIENSWFLINKGQKPVEIVLVDPKLQENIFIKDIIHTVQRQTTKWGKDIRHTFLTKALYQESKCIYIFKNNTYMNIYPHILGQR